VKFLTVLLSATLLLASVFPGSAEVSKVIDVTVTGAGKPVVLIPGLASPGAVWDDTVKQLQADHSCHVVTVAGFGGTPAVKSEHLLNDVRDQIVAYIRAQKMEKPTLIGHSLGGTLALDIAARQPELPGRVIAVDSLPFLAAIMMPGITKAEDAKQPAAGMRRMIESQSQEQFAKYQREVSIPGMVTNPEAAQRIAELCSKSDPSATAQAMSEMLTTDLRPGLANIQCPVLVLVALADKLQYGPRPMIEESYKAQYANAKQARFRFFEKAKHFIMIDDPEGFISAVSEEAAGR
jgi:N-formylmaleamate deformylase